MIQLSSFPRHALLALALMLAATVAPLALAVRELPAPAFTASAIA